MVLEWEDIQQATEKSYDNADSCHDSYAETAPADIFEDILGYMGIT